MVLCMGTVSAADVSTEPGVANETGDVPIGASEETGGADAIVGSSSEGDDVLGDGFTGSFAELEEYINNNKGYEETVYLNQDYSFDNTTDSDYNITGIYIGTFVNIDGQGHTIDAKNTRYIFNTIGKQITLKNIVFKNTNYRAIEVGSSDVTIINCTFDNNTGRAVGLSTSALNCIIDDCTFTNGQGLYTEATGTVISNSLFKNNTATTGAAIYIYSNDVVIDNCIFQDNNATRGGAIYYNYKVSENGQQIRSDDVLTIKNCQFDNNIAELCGGAIFNNNIYGNDPLRSCLDDGNIVNIISSTFNNNMAEISPNIFGAYTSDSNINEGIYYDEFAKQFEDVHNGTITLDQDYTLNHGDVYIWVNGSLTIDGQGHTINANGHRAFNFYTYFGSVTIRNLTIINGNSTGAGGAIVFDGMRSDLIIYDSRFINNTAATTGGAISMYSQNWHYPKFYNTEFINNTAGTMGGGLALTGGYAQFRIDNGTFYNNKATKSGGGVYVAGGQNTRYFEKNTKFINNTANQYGAYEAKGVGSSNTLFENNSAYSDPVGNPLRVNWGNVNYVNNIELSNFTSYFGKANVELPNDEYYFPNSIDLSKEVIIDGNGSTIIGDNQDIFRIAKNNITFKNFTLINATISIPGGVLSANYENVTFINCTLYTRGGSLSNVNFINSSYTNTINNMILDNVYFDGEKVDDEITNYFTNNLEDNATLDIPYGNYKIFPTTIIRVSNITIDGHGSTISSFGSAIFRGATNNTVIKNFIINGTSTLSCFMYGDGLGHDELDKLPTNITFINVTFNGRQVFNNYIVPTFINCTFKDINSTSNGAAVYSNTNATFSNCEFEDIFTTGSGAIYVNDLLEISDSNFTNIKSTTNGGAIRINNNATIVNCNFVNNTALSGAAIYQSNDDGVVNVSKSTFNGGVAKAAGGAIYVEGTLIIDDCDFNNNTADSSGAIDSYGPLTITNSSLTNNSAVFGGALSSDGGDAVISGCNVSGNTADVGAGISLSGDNAVIDNVNFTDNTATIRGGALMTTGANTNVTNVNATGNSAPSGAAFVLDGDGATLANSTVTDNKGVNGEGSAVEVNGENIDILNNTVHGNDGAGVLVNGNGTNITGNTFNSTRDISINPNSDIYNNQTIMNKLQEENNPIGQVQILNDVEPTIIASDVNVQQNTQFNITILNDDFEGNVSVTLNGSVIFNGTFEDIKNNDGIVTGPVLPVAGEKTVTVFFYGDPDFNNKTVNTTFIVSRVTPQMNITVANVTYGNKSIVEVRIGNKANGTITITIDDVEIASVPIVDGNATCDLGVLPGGNKTVNVQFRYNTSDYYNDNVGNFTSFCVDKAESSISIVVNDTYDIGEDVNITVSTTGSSGNLTFKINDKEYPVVNGTVNITGLPLDEYTITATLDADENYTNTEVTKTFTIKKINTDLIHLKNTKNK